MCIVWSHKRDARTCECACACVRACVCVLFQLSVHAVASRREQTSAQAVQLQNNGASSMMLVDRDLPRCQLELLSSVRSYSRGAPQRKTTR